MLREGEENQGQRAYTRCCGRVKYNADAHRAQCAYETGRGDEEGGERWSIYEVAQKSRDESP